MPSTYIKAGKKDVNQTIFMCAEDTLKRYTEVVESHDRHCREKLNIKKNNTKRTCHFDSYAV